MILKKFKKKNFRFKKKRKIEMASMSQQISKEKKRVKHNIKKKNFFFLHS